MPDLEFIHLSKTKLDDFIEVVARSRAGLPFERRLTRDEAGALTFRDPDFDPEGTWFAELNGRAVGFGSALVESNRLNAGKDDGHFDVDVIPEHRGKGIEQQLLDKSLAYLRSRGVGKALSRCPLVDDWKMSLLNSNSFRESYRVYVLARKGRTEAPSSTIPKGFSLERKALADYSDDEITEFVGAFNESFFDHLHFAPELPQRFVNYRDSLSDPVLMTTVKERGTIAGVCMSEESKLFNMERGAKAGWVDIIGVRPQFRRRGLARALLADAVGWILDQGMETVYIGAISKNEKALKLHRSFGFETEQESIWFERAIESTGA